MLCYSALKSSTRSISSRPASVLQLHAECDRVSSALLPSVKSITDELFVLDVLLNNVFKYRKEESATKPGILSQQEIDDVQPFRD